MPIRRRVSSARQAVRQPPTAPHSTQQADLFEAASLLSSHLAVRVVAGYCPTAGAITRMVVIGCKAGTYSSARGAATNATCRGCAVGMQSQQIGASSEKTCRTCAPGNFATAEGSRECSKCAAGTLQEAEGATACSPCNRGASCTEGASAALVRRS